MSVQKFSSKTRVYQQAVPFTQVNTKVIQSIKNLEAGYVWIYLLSKSADWRVIKEHIKNHFKIGDAKIKKIFSYLNKHNLIRNVTVRTEDNRKISHFDIEVLNGEDFIENPKLSTVSKPTRSEINPVETYTTRKQGTTKERTTTKERNNTKEREGALSGFIPDEGSILLCENFGLDLNRELESFINRHERKKTQYEFRRWLEHSNEYNRRKNIKNSENNVEIKQREGGRYAHLTDYTGKGTLHS